MSFLWSEQIDSILNSGILLQNLGINNWALPRASALRAIQEFEALEIPILGGDVYRLIGSAAELTHDNWYCNQETDEPRSSYLERSLKKSRIFIKNDPTHKSLFALVPKI